MAEMHGQIIGKYSIHGKPISEGTYGKVYVLRRYTSALGHGPSDLVGKCVWPGNPEGNTNQKLHHEFVRREAVFFSTLEHKNIVELVDLEVAYGMVLFVMRFYPYGDLDQHIRDLQRPLHELEAVHTHRQLLAGVRYLHFKKVVHRDLKTKNILVSRFIWVGDLAKADVKVSDFGQSKMCGELFGGASDYARRVGTIQYMPPEIFQRSGVCDFAIDSWSLGIVLYEIKTGAGSFPGDTFHEDDGSRVKCPCMSSQAQLDEDINTHLPPLLRELCSGHLKLDSRERSTAQEAAVLLEDNYPAPANEASTECGSEGSSSSSSSSNSSMSSMGLQQESEDQPSSMSDAAYWKSEYEKEKRRRQEAESEALGHKLQKDEAESRALAQELQNKVDLEQQQLARDLAYAMELEQQQVQRALKRRRVSKPGDCFLNTILEGAFNGVCLQAGFGGFFMRPPQAETSLLD